MSVQKIKQCLKNFCFAFAAIGLMACGDNTKSASYNVYFWFPDDSKEYHLGVSSGLDSCGSIAHSFANTKGLTRADGWSYVCCMKTATSECAEKHR